MRASLFSTLAVVAVLSGSTNAIKGVVSDTLTSDSQGCYSLCGLTGACYSALYQTECRECLLLDCALSNVPDGFVGEGKSTIEIKPPCDSGMVPKPRDSGCKGAPSAGTTTGTSTGTTTGATSTTPNGAESLRALRVGAQASVGCFLALLLQQM